MRRDKETIDYWTKKRKEIRIQNEKNGFSVDDSREKGYCFFHESNSCPVCSSDCSPNHELGVEEGYDLIWYHYCENCGTGLRKYGRKSTQPPDIHISRNTIESYLTLIKKLISGNSKLY